MYFIFNRHLDVFNLERYDNKSTLWCGFRINNPFHTQLLYYILSTLFVIYIYGRNVNLFNYNITMLLLFLNYSTNIMRNKVKYLI